eukprot:jgi/Bigna1/82295/fgenesh1_pg.90_\
MADSGFKPGSNEDLAAMAARFKAAGQHSHPQYPPLQALKKSMDPGVSTTSSDPQGAPPAGNSDEDLAALAASIRGHSAPPSAAHPTKNSDAELKMLAQKLGAAPTTATTDVGEIAKKLLSGGSKPQLGIEKEEAPVTEPSLLRTPSLTSSPFHVAVLIQHSRPLPDAQADNIGSAAPEEVPEEDPEVLPAERAREGGEQNLQNGDVDGSGADAKDESNEDSIEWVQYLDEESGCPYWYNTRTSETTWEEPIEDFALDESAAELLKDLSGLSGGRSSAEVREGFICPKCYLALTSQEELLRHCMTCAGKTPDTAARRGGKSKAASVPVSATIVPQKPQQHQSMTDRLLGYFGGCALDAMCHVYSSHSPYLQTACHVYRVTKDDSMDVKDMLDGAGQSGGQVVNLTEKQLRKLIGLNKRNKMLKSKLQKQTEKYNQNIKVLVERDRKYKVLLQKKEEHHLKEVHVLKEQNARLAKGIAQQHEEFKRKNFKVLKQNQSMGKQLSAALIQLQEKAQLETDNKIMPHLGKVLKKLLQLLMLDNASQFYRQSECIFVTFESLRQENFKMREYIKRLKRELSEQKSIVDTLKDATKDAHKKIYELESHKGSDSANADGGDGDGGMPVADLQPPTGDDDDAMASV